MKRFLPLFLAVFLPFSNNAYGFTVDGINYITTTETSVSVYSPSSPKSGHLAIPENVSYNGKTYEVTMISDYAFSYNCDQITAITLPKSVTVIGRNAFSGCTLSDSLIIKGAITSIGENAFKSGTSITKLDIYEYSTWWNASFGSTLSNPIYYCKTLYSRGKQVKSLEINCTNIPEGAFQYFNVHTLIIGPDVKTMGKNCFMNSSIMKTIWLPNDIPSGTIRNAIGMINYCSDTKYQAHREFQNNKDLRLYKNLTSRFEVDGIIYAEKTPTTCDVIDCNYTSQPVSVNIGSTVTYKGRTLNVESINPYACYNDQCITGDIIVSHPGDIGKYAFYMCYEATGKINVSNSGKVGRQAFYGCKKARGSLIVENGGDVEISAFESCLSVSSGKVSNRGNIEAMAFKSCKAMMTLTVNNDGYINENAFSSCSGIQILHINNNGNIRQNAFSECTGLDTLTVTSNGHIYENAFINSIIKKRAIIENRGDIKTKAFYNIKGGFEATINNGGTLGTSAFANSAMSNLTINNNVTSVESSCFGRCTFSGDVYINNVGSLGKSAFSYSLMRNLTIANNVTSVESSCFSHCIFSGIVNLNNSGSLGTDAFSHSTIKGKATIQISGEIQSSAFSFAIGNFDVDILCAGVVPSSCFSNAKMAKVVVGDNITSIDDNAFSNSVFSSITIGKGVKTIKDSAFQGATGFTLINLPNNVTALGTACFKNCTTMQEITLSPNLLELLDETFSGCKALKSLYIYRNINNIGNFVFNDCSALKVLTFQDKSGTYNLGFGGTSASPAPLFNTCGLDTVYVGGRLEYETSSPTYSPFYGHSSLRSIKFNDEEVQVYLKEFENCTNLENVYMGANINHIGYYAFSGCTKLAHFNVGPAVKELGAYSFNSCTALKSIDLANTVKICKNTFSGCSKLAEIIIPPTTIDIQDQVFTNCSSLKNLFFMDRTSTLNLGFNQSKCDYKGLTGVGKPLFSDCPLDSVYIGGPIDYYKSKECGYSPFFYNDSLRSVFITNKERTVYENEFYNCKGLKSIRLGDGVTEIESYGFHNCISLEYFEFASTLQTIGSNAFSDCSKIKTIISHAETPPTCGEQALVDINHWVCKVYVPKEALELYKAADQWEYFFIYPLATGIILNQTTLNFTHVGQASTLTAMITPDNATDKSVTWTSSNTSVATVDSNGKVTAVANGTATITAKTNDGSNLTATCIVTVNIPILATSISLDKTLLTFAVKNQTATLTATVLPSNATDKSVTWTSSNTSVATVDANGKVTAIADGTSTITATTNDGTNLSASCIVNVVRDNSNIIAFADPSVKAICIANWDANGDGELSENEAAAVTSLGETFLKHSEIKSFNELHYFTGLLSIDGFAFYRCSELISVTFPECITTIGYAALSDCSSLTSINIPDNVESIGGFAFCRCSSLMSISIPEGVTRIGESAFMCCSGLTSVTLPDNLTFIGVESFEECSSLTSIIIPAKVTTIKSGAFDDCPNLTTVFVNNPTPVSIDKYTFSNRTNCTLYVPAGCKAAYEAADYWKDFKEIIEYGNHGDVNNDGKVNGADIVAVINNVLEDDILGDVNGDGRVNGADIVAVINYVLDFNGVREYVHRISPIEEHRNIETTEMNATLVTEGISVDLMGDEHFTAFQMTLTLPDGVTLNGVEGNILRLGNHELLFHKRKDGKYLVLGYAADNSCIEGNSGQFLMLQTSGRMIGTALLTDVLFFTPNAETKQLNDISIDLETGIIENNIEVSKGKNNNNMFDISGRPVKSTHQYDLRTQNLRRGVYVRNGHKFIVK